MTNEVRRAVGTFTSRTKAEQALRQLRDAGLDRSLARLEGGDTEASVGFGIPEDRAAMYQQVIQNGGYLVVVDAPEAEIACVEAVLQAAGVQNYGIYDAPGTPYQKKGLYDDRYTDIKSRVGDQERP
ncbi:hypothetical protein [Anthocerotibacter panamensis]|uniref:hypothetical protein n=1 Tax=Anthocerotibacter panamensis TaxID=2857077 RepID=UPI001C404D99|nr:hypothetical protein [Anthocerotibacter panamensis]